MKNKTFNIFYIISIFIYAGLFLWYYSANWAGGGNAQIMAMSLYSVILAIVISLNIFKKSKTSLNQTTGLILRIISYIIFILVIFYLILSIFGSMFY